MTDRLKHITESEIVAAAKVLWRRHGEGYDKSAKIYRYQRR